MRITPTTILCFVMGLIVPLALLLVPKKPTNPTEMSQPSPTPVPIRYSAWLPYWEETRALSTLTNESQMLTTVLPGWYRINAKGNLEEISSRKKNEIRQIAIEKNIGLMPSIFNEFDPKRIHTFLSNKIQQQTVITQLQEIAQEHNYVGFDLDWEEVASADAQLFEDFVKELQTTLARDQRILSVTVHARTGKANDWKPATVFDWTRLATIADQIRIMAYDYHHAESSAGAITPPTWLKDILRYAVTTIPREKIILALPTYGYDWNQEQGEPRQYMDAISVLNQENGSYQYDKNMNALMGTYELEEGAHTIWFEDARTIIEKVAIGKAFGITQFCFWHIGGEDQRLWKQLPIVTDSPPEKSSATGE